MSHLLHAAAHARIVLQALPLATAPLALQVMLGQLTGRTRKFSFSGDPAVEQQFSQLPVAEQAAHDLLYGHVHFGIDAPFPESTLYLTMLRDPIESAVAFYYLVLSSPAHYLHEILTSNNWDLRALATAQREELDNPMVRWLNPAPPRRIEVGCVSRDMLEAAKRNLEERYLFGLTERFDESLLLFRRTLGWSDVTYAHLGTPPESRHADSIDPKTLRLIRDSSGLDLELYEFASKLFDRRLAEVCPDLETQLADFRSQNNARRDSITVLGEVIEPVAPAADPPPAHDVTWLASYPRSGNTWLRFLLDSYAFPPAEHLNDLGRLSIELDWWVAEADKRSLPNSWIYGAIRKIQLAHHRAAHMPSDLFIKSHYLCAPGHPFIDRSKRAIYLLRNPLDVLLSGLNFAELTTPDKAMDESSYARSFIEQGGDKSWINVGYGSWEGHARSWLDQTDFPVLLVRYEDLKADPPAQFRRILQFLEIPIDEDRLAAAISNCSFQRLRNLEIASRATTKVESLRRPDRFFFHKGQTGQSLAHLGPEIQAQFAARFGPVMTRLGYT